MSLRSQSASVPRPDAPRLEPASLQARERFVWPPPAEDLDDVALLQFPAEISAGPETRPGRATEAPRRPAAVPAALPMPPASGPAPDRVPFLLEDFPRAGPVSPPAEPTEELRSPQFGTARWLLVLVAVLGFVTLIGVQSIIEARLQGPLPVPGPAPTAPQKAEPYRPPAIDEVELEASR